MGGGGGVGGWSMGRKDRGCSGFEEEQGEGGWGRVWGGRCGEKGVKLWVREGGCGVEYGGREGGMGHGGVGDMDTAHAKLSLRHRDGSGRVGVGALEAVTCWRRAGGRRSGLGGGGWGSGGGRGAVELLNYLKGIHMGALASGFVHVAIV